MGSELRRSREEYEDASQKAWTIRNIFPSTANIYIGLIPSTVLGMATGIFFGWVDLHTVVGFASMLSPLAVVITGIAVVLWAAAIAERVSRHNAYNSWKKELEDAARERDTNVPPPY